LSVILVSVQFISWRVQLSRRSIAPLKYISFNQATGCHWFHILNFSSSVIYIIHSFVSHGVWIVMLCSAHLLGLWSQDSFHMWVTTIRPSFTIKFSIIQRLFWKCYHVFNLQLWGIQPFQIGCYATSITFYILSCNCCILHQIWGST
jgi:hypothetical protein